MCLSRVVIAFEDDVVDVHRSFVLFFFMRIGTKQPMIYTLFQ